MLDCPSCQKTLKTPKILSCTHFFCEKCVDDLLKSGEGVPKTQIMCPVCKEPTDVVDLKDVQFVDKILTTYQQEISCDNCEKAPAILRCMECGLNYCGSCKMDHDKVELFRLHLLWTPVSASAPQSIVDEVIFCRKHTRDEIRLHCKDCNKLVCTVCTGDVNEHKRHHTESIDTALDQLVPKVKGSEKLLERRIKVISKAKQKLIQNNVKTKEEFISNIEKMDEEYKEILQQLNEMHSRRKEEFQRKQQEYEKKQQEKIAELELKLNSKQCLLQLSKATVEKVKNSSLLDAIQNGLIQSLIASEKEREDLGTTFVTYFDVTKPKAKVFEILQTFQFKLCKENLLLHKVFKKLANAKFQLQSTSFPTFTCRRFEVIDNELWCVEEGTCKVRVFDPSGKHIKDLNYPEMKEIRNITAFNNFVLFNTRNGLFFALDRKVGKLCNGKFIDTCCNKNHLLALGHSRKEVKLFGLKLNEFYYENSIILKFNLNACKIMLASGSFVYACNDCGSVIQFTYKGEQVRTFGSYGSGYGQMKYPRMSEIDDEGNILIAGNDNTQIDILKNDGSFVSLKIPELEYGPMYARVFDNKLFVVPFRKVIQVFKVIW